MLLRGIPRKYAPLAAYLAALDGDRITLTLSEIERIIGQALPRSAWTHGWWANTAGFVHARVWLRAGWEVSARSLRTPPAAITFVRRLPDTTA
jgi:hypothetical protein